MKKINFVTSWSNAQIFHWKWLKLSFWVKIVVILSVAQLVTTVIFFSAWSRVRFASSGSQFVHFLLLISLKENVLNSKHIFVCNKFQEHTICWIVFQEVKYTLKFSGNINGIGSSVCTLNWVHLILKKVSGRKCANWDYTQVKQTSL